MKEAYHVYPVNDLREHVTDGLGCECCPKIEEYEESLLIIHNSWDGREITEWALGAISLN